jgi:hypothetical protein
MGHHDHHAAHAPQAPPVLHGGPDDEYAYTPEGSSYEHTDANVWVIAKFGIWLAITAVIVHVGIWVLWGTLVRQAEVTREPQYPLATQPRLPPEPRLQQFPANEIDDFRRSEDSRLNGYGYVNKDAGVVHIPIAEAMRLTVERGLPSRTEDANQSANPGEMASDASAGRVMERRRQ